MHRRRWVLALTSAFVLVRIGAVYGDDCRYVCDSVVKACAAATRAQRATCDRECPADEESGPSCRARCREQSGAARQACRDDRDSCRARCRRSTVPNACESACGTSRGDCLRSLRSANEAPPCRDDCEKTRVSTTQACGPDDTCVRRAAGALPACLAACASDAKQAQETCHHAFDVCVAACPARPPPAGS